MFNILVKFKIIGVYLEIVKYGSQQSGYHGRDPASFRSLYQSSIKNQIFQIGKTSRVIT